MMAFLLFGALWCTTFVGAFTVANIFSGFGFKNIYFATLLTCKGLTALTIFNILSSVGVISPLFYAIVVLYALISCAVVSPVVAFFQMISRYRKSKNAKPTEPLDDIPRILVLPRTGYLAPVATTVAAWIANSFEHQSEILFARLIDDLDHIDQFIPLLQEPISAAILSSDPIFGPCQVRWNGIRPSGHTSYRGVLAPSLESAYLKLAAGNKANQRQPYRYQILGYDGTIDSRRIIVAALSQQQVQLIIVTGQPAIALAGAHSALVVISGDRSSHTMRDLFNLQSSGISVSYWRAAESIGRPPEVATVSTIPELLETVSHVAKPSFDAIFCSLPDDHAELFSQLDAASHCHVPVIFEGRAIAPPASTGAIKDMATEIRVDADFDDDSDNEPH
jgi:hypothetical protein